MPYNPQQILKSMNFWRCHVVTFNKLDKVSPAEKKVRVTMIRLASSEKLFQGTFITITDIINERHFGDFAELKQQASS